MMMLNNRNNNRLANVLFILCVIVLLLVVQTNNVLAQRNNGRLQRTTCPRGEIKAQRKTVSDDFKEVYMAYNRRPYTVTDMDITSNLPDLSYGYCLQEKYALTDIVKHKTIFFLNIYKVI